MAHELCAQSVQRSISIDSVARATWKSPHPSSSTSLAAPYPSRRAASSELSQSIQRVLELGREVVWNHNSDSPLSTRLIQAYRFIPPLSPTPFLTRTRRKKHITIPPQKSAKNRRGALAAGALGLACTSSQLPWAAPLFTHPHNPF